LLNNEDITINGLSLNGEYVLYEETLTGYEASIIGTSSEEVKLGSEGYAFTLTEPTELSLVVKNKKNVTPPPEEIPVVNPTPVTPEKLPQTGYMFGDLLPLLGAAFVLAGLIVFKRSKACD